MFARKIRVEYEENGERKPCPLKWLDSFSMRNFTNDQVFDDTLPVADGDMEIGTRVPVDKLKDSMEEWFRKKSYLPKDAALSIEEFPLPGVTVVLRSIPLGLLNGLPEEDQKAIKESVGKPIRLEAYGSGWRAELSFEDSSGDTHYIYVDPKYLSRE